MKISKPANMRTEFFAGLTTFFTMSYILIVNPSILATDGTGMAFSGVLTATALLCFLMTLLMGLYANLPFAVAPGMGINAYFAFSVVIGQGVSWQVALGIVFWAGIAFLIASLTNIRVKIVQAIPHNLRIAVAAGIGLFLSFIGLKNAGLIVADPATFVRFGALDFETIMVLIGLFVISALLHRKNPLAFLIGIVLITAVAAISGKIQTPQNFFSPPDFESVFMQVDIWGALKLALLPTIVAIFFTDLFDSISTFIGVSQATGLQDEKGNPKNLKEGLAVDAMATFGASIFGTSSGTAYIESSAGIEAGGKTGWTSVFTALFFLPCLFIAPLAGMVPAYATAPVLILVGALMFKSIGKISFDKIEEALPAFLTIALIPLTFSITQGILWGFISHVLLFLLCGRKKEIPPMMYGLSICCVALLVLENW